MTPLCLHTTHMTMSGMACRDCLAVLSSRKFQCKHIPAHTATEQRHKAAAMVVRYVRDFVRSFADEMGMVLSETWGLNLSARGLVPQVGILVRWSDASVCEVRRLLLRFFLSASSHLYCE